MCLMLKSLSHFELIFVHHVRVCSNFTDLHTGVQLSQHDLLTRLSFPYLYSCLFFEDELTVGVWVYFWVLYSIDRLACFCINMILF